MEIIHGAETWPIQVDLALLERMTREDVPETYDVTTERTKLAQAWRQLGDDAQAEYPVNQLDEKEMQRRAALVQLCRACDALQLPYPFQPESLERYRLVTRPVGRLPRLVALIEDHRRYMIDPFLGAIFGWLLLIPAVLFILCRYFGWVSVWGGLLVVVTLPLFVHLFGLAVMVSATRFRIPTSGPLWWWHYALGEQPVPGTPALDPLPVSAHPIPAFVVRSAGNLQERLPAWSFLVAMPRGMYGTFANPFLVARPPGGCGEFHLEVWRGGYTLNRDSYCQERVA